MRCFDDGGEAFDGEALDDEMPNQELTESRPVDVPVAATKWSDEDQLELEQLELELGSTGDDTDTCDETEGISAAEREMKKTLYIQFFREHYARLSGSTMIDPDDQIRFGEGVAPREPIAEPIDDIRQPVGTLTIGELNRHDCYSQQMLISIYGDIFDVSDHLDKFGKDGQFKWCTGHDITWSIMVGDDPEQVDYFYDVFKTPPEILDRKLQGVMNWWAFYEKEYGRPVGRLNAYEREWELPSPPHHKLQQEECSIM